MALRKVQSWVVIYRWGSRDLGFQWRVIPHLHDKADAEAKAADMTTQNWTAKAWPAGEPVPKTWEGEEDGTIEPRR